MYKFLCQQCGKPSQSKHYNQRFCSNDCSFASRRTNPDRQCAVCNKTFRRSGKRIPNYCSVECMSIGYTTYYLTEKPCAYCGIPFLPKDKRSNYCSKSCSAKAGKIRKIKLVTCTCAYCGKSELRKTRKRRKYCSDKCKRNSMRKHNTLYKFTYSQKQVIKARDMFKCVICESDCQLEVDHILAIALGGLNTIENGQTLCHNCHVIKTTKDKLLIRKLREH